MPAPARTAAPPCQVRVTVYEIDAPDDAIPVHDKTGDHSERFFRDWITNTTFWAVRNGHEVTISPA